MGVINRIIDWWKRLPDQLAAQILDWLIVIAFLILVSVIYVPRSIWAEEKAAVDESRRRMMILQNSQDFFHTITGEYSVDGRFLFQLVSQTHDTLIGDTTFVGEQIVHVNGEAFHVNIPEGLGIQMDTTFSKARPIRYDVLDTIYTVVLWDAELSALDTIYMNGARALSKFLDDPALRAIADTAYGSHSEVDSDYTWHRYRLTPDLLLSPITQDQFELALDSTGTELTIADPVKEGYTEGRYLFFKFRPRNIGRIVGSDPSWVKR